MSTFDESDHPRGQAGNAGQFRAKRNDPPASELGELTHPATVDDFYRIGGRYLDDDIDDGVSVITGIRWLWRRLSRRS